MYFTQDWICLSLFAKLVTSTISMCKFCIKYSDEYTLYIVMTNAAIWNKRYLNSVWLMSGLYQIFKKAAWKQTNVTYLNFTSLVSEVRLSPHHPHPPPYLPHTHHFVYHLSSQAATYMCILYYGERPKDQIPLQLVTNRFWWLLHKLLIAIRKL